MSKTYIPRQGQEWAEPVKLASADGAIIARGGIVVITKGTAAALTLAAPSNADDGKKLTVISNTAAAHTVTVAGGANGGGTGSDVGTFGGAIGDGFVAVAFNGRWLIVSKTNVTFA